MNELLFALHILIALGFLFWAVRLGKEALTALIALQAVLANLFVVKQMRLFGLGATCGDVFAVGAILGLNLLQEYWGKDAAKRAAAISLLGLIFFLFMSQIHLLYRPLDLDTTQTSFVTLFSSAPRIAFASIAAYYIVQKFDIALFSRFRALFGERRLGLRVALSSALSQALDTLLFTYLGLYGIASSLLDIAIVSFAIKCAVIAFSSPIASFSKRWVSRATV